MYYYDIENITALNFLPVWKTPMQPLPNFQYDPKARVSLVVVCGSSLTSYSRWGIEIRRLAAINILENALYSVQYVWETYSILSS